MGLGEVETQSTLLRPPQATLTGSPLASFPQRVLLLLLPTPLPPPTSHSLHLISGWDCAVSFQAVYGGQIRSCMAGWLAVGRNGGGRGRGGGGGSGGNVPY